MPQHRSTIEIMFPDDAPLVQAGPLQIRPVIVDTSFLVADLLASIRSRRRSTFLAAVEFGVLRPFAAHHVWAEMGRKVLEVPGRHGLDPELASRIWWELYVPRIHFVDIAGLPIPSSASEILGRDASDAPTVALAGLLAPVVVLAGDRDLTDLGVAAQHYTTVVEHAGTLTVVSEGTWASMVALILSFALMRAGYRGAAALLRHPLGQLGALAGVAVLLATSERWWPNARGRASGLRESAGSVFNDRVVPFLTDMFSAHELAQNAFDLAQYDCGDASLEQSVARCLASSPRPLTRAEIASLMLPAANESERRRLVGDMRSVLVGHHAFCRSGRSRWSLGRAGIDFGGGNESPEAPLPPAIPALPVRSVSS